MRWVDEVVADLKVMKIKHRMEKTKDREQWRLVFEGSPRAVAPRGWMDSRTPYTKKLIWLPYR